MKGFNSRLAPLQAALLRVKLQHLDEWNKRRRALAQSYQESLEGVTGLELPHAPNAMDTVWHVFVIRHGQRNALQEHLKRMEVGTLIHYPVPPHLSDAYAEMGFRKGDFPLTEQMAEFGPEPAHGAACVPGPSAGCRRGDQAVRGLGGGRKCCFRITSRHHQRIKSNSVRKTRRKLKNCDTPYCL